MNDVAMMKRQQNKIHGSYQASYQDIHRRPPSQNFGKNPTLTPPPTRLQIEEAPKQAMCSFHMTFDHDERDCPKWLNFIQLAKNAIATEQASGEPNVENENPSTYFLEYGSDSERGGTVFTNLQNHACTVMTRG